MQERERVRAETLDGLLAAAFRSETDDHAPALTVLEFWEARDSAHRSALSESLRRHLPALNSQPGIRGVDFTELKDRPGRYMAIFRYEDEGARAGFLASEPVRLMRAEVDPLWTRVSESTWSYGV
jgi:quinol monooxygenase YgiN